MDEVEGLKKENEEGSREIKKWKDNYHKALLEH